MLFNSTDYALFLALVLGGYWLLARRAPFRVPRLSFVLVASSAFYMAWNPWYLALILFSTLVDWLVARNIAAHEDEAARRRWLYVSVAVNLTLLGTFKYFDFLGGAVADGLALLGVSVSPPTLADVAGGLLDVVDPRAPSLEGALPPRLDSVALPVGISFYTFESLSYCIDVYRRKCEPAKTPLELLFFITFFPKLVAGPIARPSDLLPQVQGEPGLTPQKVGEALFLIGTGLVKKVMFADYVSVNLVDRVFDAPDNYTAPEVVVALYGFTLQIYMDFSGYTDIARGSAKLFGIELPENFDRPYQAKNPAEFWRRWHMTLSTWLRDYLYFPLGGSKLGPVRTYVNLWITIFLIGLWHGASWTFVIYGSLQASAVVAHRFVTRWQNKPSPVVRTTKEGEGPYRAQARDEAEEAVDPPWLAALKIFGTMQFVVFTRILFRASDLDNARAIVGRIGSGTWGLVNVAPWVWAALVVGFAVHYTPRHWYTSARQRFLALPSFVQGLLLAGLVALLMQIATTETVPYIYFQF
jgi:alginate O-acetyltransferase complex protein AlgI